MVKASLLVMPPEDLQQGGEFHPDIVVGPGDDGSAFCRTVAIGGFQSLELCQSIILGSITVYDSEYRHRRRVSSGCRRWSCDKKASCGCGHSSRWCSRGGGQR